MSLPHQDWETVILRKPKAAAAKPPGWKKPPEEGSEFDIPKAPTSLKTSIQQGRAARGMSQDVLASQMGVHRKIIQEYETGKALPNNAFISRLERVLKCKLPRAVKKKKVVDDDSTKH
jgi:ribosome-binding protein aMBF1 (putative translation factor)